MTDHGLSVQAIVAREWDRRLMAAAGGEPGLRWTFPGDVEAEKLIGTFKALVLALGLSTRAINCLKRAGVDPHDVLAVSGLTTQELLAVPGLGPKTLKEIKMWGDAHVPHRLQMGHP